MNTITLTGINQRQDVQQTKNGGTWVRGAIRVRNTLQNAEGKYESSFINYKILGKRADTFARYHAEGQPLNITGSLMQERWESQDGTKREQIVVIVSDFDLPPFAQKTSPSKSQGRKQPSIADDFDTSDLPF